MIYDVDHRFVRYDCVALNVVYQHSKGARMRRLVARLSRDPTGQCVVYSRDHTVRISSGTRRGRVVKRSEVGSKEAFCIAGLNKILREGSRPQEFSSRRRGDVAVVDLLAPLAKGDYRIGKLKKHIPSFFITVPQSRVPVLRNTAAASEYLKGFSDYDEELTEVENIRELSRHVSTPGGERVGYPLDFFQGRGVVAALPWKNFGDWIRVPDLTLDTPSLVIQWPRANGQ